MLIIDPPATAGGTDIDPSATPGFLNQEEKPREQLLFLVWFSVGQGPVLPSP